MGIATEKVILEQLTDQNAVIVAKVLNKLIDDTNTAITNLSLSTLKSSIVEKNEISAGNFQLTHTLGYVPKNFVVLLQIGGGTITAQDTKWTNKVIYLNNSSGTIKRLRVMVE